LSEDRSETSLALISRWKQNKTKSFHVDDHPYYTCCLFNSHHGILHQVEDHPYYQCFCTHQTPSGVTTPGETENYGSHLQCKKACLQYALVCDRTRHKDTLLFPILQLGVQHFCLAPTKKGKKKRKRNLLSINLHQKKGTDCLALTSTHPSYNEPIEVIIMPGGHMPEVSIYCLGYPHPPKKRKEKKTYLIIK
jgi:hypothetical protein